MYLNNQALTVNWRLEPVDDPILLASLDLYLTPPDGIVVYTPAAIGAQDYVAPTATEFGMLSYIFTPNQLGLWTVTLTDGTEFANTIWYTYYLQISINDLYTKKFIVGDVLSSAFP